MNIQQQIASLLAERAELDTELESLRAQAVQELEAAKATVASLDAVLKPQPSRIGPERTDPPAKIVRNELDETDAGNGIPERSDNTSAADFREELAQLRERTREKRSRLQ